MVRNGKNHFVSHYIKRGKNGGPAKKQQDQREDEENFPLQEGQGTQIVLSIFII